MKTRFFSAALATTLALPFTANAFVSPSWLVGPVGPQVPLAAPGAPPAAPAVPYTASAPMYAPPMSMPGGSVPLLPMQPADQSFRAPLTFDIRGFYGFLALPDSTFTTDMSGLEMEFACYFTPRNAFTIGVSFGAGFNDNVSYMQTPHGSVPVADDFVRTDFSVMLGYRFTQALTPYTTLSFSLRGGLDVQDLSYSEYDEPKGWQRDWGWLGDRSSGDARCGFGYAASVMLETQLSRQMQLQIGYQFRGATTRPDTPATSWGASAESVHSLRWHEVHIGLRFVF